MEKRLTLSGLDSAAVRDTAANVDAITELLDILKHEADIYRA